MMRFALAWVVGFVLGWVSCASQVHRPDGGVGLLQVGADAPEVVGRTVEGVEVRLSASRGRPAIVYFYPRDGTPGCTKEACAFRDAWRQFEAAKVTLLGVSSDSADDHVAFQRKERLPFALASDSDGKLARAYGVRHAFWGHARVTFLVAPDGRVARVWPDVDPGVHAHEVLAALASLSK
jgi:peroxiredoxin Q/BCP